MSEVQHWNDRYLQGDTPWDTNCPSTELQVVVEEQHIQPCRVLELGCGTGNNAVWLANQGFDVTAVDLSKAALEHARERAKAAGVSVRFIEADVLTPPDLGGPYPFFFDRGCYHVVRRIDPRAYLRTLTGVTEPGTLGLVLAGNAREKHEPGPPVVTETELREELGSLFEIVQLREIRFDQVEAVGVRFLGWSCLVRRQ